MKITNKFGLPKVFETLAENSLYRPKSNSFGATTLMLPAQEIVLRQRKFDELEQDVTDMTNMLFGNAVHDMLEKHDKTNKAEKYLKHEAVKGHYVSGKIDLIEGTTVIDYKTAKCNRIIYEDFEDWRTQGLIYAWLALKNQIVVDKIKFIAILKDWSEYGKKFADMQDKPYPDKPVYIYELKVTSNELDEIEGFIMRKLEKILEFKDMTDAQILEQKLDTKFAPIVKHCVFKHGGKRASKIFDNEQDANNYMESKGAHKYYLTKRVEENPLYDMMCTAMQHVNKIEKRRIDYGNTGIDYWQER